MATYFFFTTTLVLAFVCLVLLCLLLGASHRITVLQKAGAVPESVLGDVKQGLHKAQLSLQLLSVRYGSLGGKVDALSKQQSSHSEDTSLLLSEVRALSSSISMDPGARVQ